LQIDEVTDIAGNKCDGIDTHINSCKTSAAKDIWKSR